MSTELETTNKTKLPEGFTAWAEKYFLKRRAPPEPTLDLEALFDNAYQRLRRSVAKQLGHAAEVPELKDTIEARLLTCDELESIPQLQQLLSDLSSLLADRRLAVETKLGKLYDQTIVAQLDLKRDPNEARSTIRKYLKAWNIGEAERELRRFEEQILRAKSTHLGDTDQIQKRHEETGLQNSRYARNTHLAKSIATRLIDGDGNLQLEALEWQDLLPDSPHDLASLMEEIREGKHPDLPQSEHALSMLKRLQQDEKLRNKLLAIKKPDDEQGSAARLIRSTLGLDPSDPITDAHARQAALSGLLFQARQGRAGSCFTTATACLVQRLHPDKFLEDIKNLFSDGKLTRNITDKHGTPHTLEIPLNATILQTNLELPVSVPRGNLTLHLAPEMTAAMDVLRIPADEQKQALESAARDLRCERALQQALDEKLLPPALFVNPNTREAVLQDALGRLRGDPLLSIQAALSAVFSERAMTLATGTDPSDIKAGQLRRQNALAVCTGFDDPQGVDALSPEDLLERLVAQRRELEKRNAPPNPLPENVLGLARDAFLGQQDNLVMRAWEYTNGSMVEQHPDGDSKQMYMRNGVLNTVENFLESAVSKLKVGDSTKVALRQMRDLMINAYERLLTERLETRYDPSVKNRQQATSVDGHSSSGGFSLFFQDRPIVSDSDYSTILEDLWREAAEGTKSSLTPGQLKNYQWMVDKLAPELKKPAFHEQIVENTVGTDQASKNKMAKPWTFVDGGIAPYLMQIYYDAPAILKHEDSPPLTDGDELGEFLLGKLKDMKVDEILAGGEGSSTASIPVDTVSVHSFNLLPGNPGILALLQNFDKPAQGLQQFKTNEQAKNVERNSLPVALTVPPQGLFNTLLDNAVQAFHPDDRQLAKQELLQRLQSKGLTAWTVQTAVSEINAALWDYLTNILGVPPQAAQQDLAKLSDQQAVTIFAGVVPKQEFQPLVDLSMQRLKVPEQQQAPLRKAVLESLQKEVAVEPRVLVETVERELKKLGIDAERTKIEAALREPGGLVFADSNWGDGDHRTLMSLVVNPVSGSLELWDMNEDGSQPSKMDQDKWVKNASWRVYEVPGEFGGITGDQAWEQRRGVLQGKVNQCVRDRVGDISPMLVALEIADTRYREGKRAEAEKALDQVERLATPAAKLADNIDAAYVALDAFSQEVEKVAVPSAKAASARVMALAKDLTAIRHPDHVEPFLKRHAAICELLQQGQQPLGVSVDVAQLLKQT